MLACVSAELMFRAHWLWFIPFMYWVMIITMSSHSWKDFCAIALGSICLRSFITKQGKQEHSTSLLTHWHGGHLMRGVYFDLKRKILSTKTLSWLLLVLFWYKYLPRSICHSSAKNGNWMKNSFLLQLIKSKSLSLQTAYNYNCLGTVLSAWVG